MHGFGPIDPLYIFSGFCVGVLVGMTGVGGGSFMTPLLILLFGIHPTTAVGTDLLFAASTKTVGTVGRAAAQHVVSFTLGGVLLVTALFLIAGKSVRERYADRLGDLGSRTAATATI